MTRSRDVANIDGILTAKGDIYGATEAATPARLAVGANATVLTADSAEATGMKWAAVGGGMTVIASGSIANSTTGFSITSIPSTYNYLQLVIRNSQSASDINTRLRLNNDSSAIYSYLHNFGEGTTNYSGTAQTASNVTLDNNNSAKSANVSTYTVNLWDYAGNAWKNGSFNAYNQTGASSNYNILTGSFGWRNTSAINRIDMITASASLFAGAGTYTLYGVK